MKDIVFLLLFHVLMTLMACKPEPPSPESTISKREPLSRILPVGADNRAESQAKPSLIPPVIEMKSRASGSAPFSKTFFPVLGGRYAVIDVAPQATARGARPVDRNTAVKAIPAGEQSEALKKLLNRELTVGFADGTVEKRSAKRAVYAAAYIVHFGTAQQWEEQKMSGAEIAADLWSAARASGSVYLALELESGPAGKEPPLFAAVSVSEVYSVAEADSKALLSVMTAASKTEAFRGIQDEFREGGGVGSWETNSHIECLAFAGKGGRFYALSVSAGMGCGEFHGSYHALFMEKNETPVYLGYPEDFAVPDFVDDHSAYLAVDIDSDGFPEFVGNGKIFYRSGKAWNVYETPVPSGDCPC